MIHLIVILKRQIKWGTFYRLQAVYRYLSEVTLSSKCSFLSITLEAAFCDVPVREEQGSRILLKLLEVSSNNVQGAAQNVELYMAFAQ